MTADAMGPSQVDPRDLSPGEREGRARMGVKGKSKDGSKVLPWLMLVPFAASASITIQ